MTKDEALELALEALEYLATQIKPDYEHSKAITTIKSALKAKDEPYAFEASMYPSVIIDPVTGNVSIGTVTKACGLECDCTDVCKQDDYKVLWQQMCERCDELDKKLAQRKPLTDEEIKSQWFVFWEADCHPWAIDFARAIEAKLKEKNT
jgi:hypothetical protein